MIVVRYRAIIPVVVIVAGFSFWPSVRLNAESFQALQRDLDELRRSQANNLTPATTSY
jgi:hypothetical protein